MSLGPVLVGISGLNLSAVDREHLNHPLVGGVVLFTRNFESREQLQELIGEIRQVRSPRLLLAVDQEGGRVQRFRDGFTRLPPLGKLGEIYQADQAKAKEYAHWHGRVMALEMLDLGIDISFTPVLDLERGSSVIGDRAFAGDPDSVIDLAGSYLDGMHAAGMKSTGKHFPGHGSVHADSHTDDVCDARVLDEIQRTDMRPFDELSEELDAMMIAHVEYPCVDNKPAGYSEAWLAEQLRTGIGYSGVVFSDDLGMHAAKTLNSLRERTEVSLQAGCDAVLVCQPEDVGALLQDYPDNFDWPDVTARLQTLYGLPSLRPGTLFESENRNYQLWRERLEQLA